MKKLFIFISCFTFFNLIEAEIVTNDDGCSAKKLQIMRPDYPGSPQIPYQGYSVVSFDIKKDGSVTNVETTESMCVMSRNNDGSILFKKCPFFKKNSYTAARYIKFTPPTTEDGSSCSIEDQEHRFSFRKYRHIYKDEYQFLLQNDVKTIRYKDFQTDNELNLHIYKLFYPQENAVPLTEPLKPANTSLNRTNMLQDRQFSRPLERPIAPSGPPLTRPPGT